MTHAQTWASYSALYRFCSLSRHTTTLTYFLCGNEHWCVAGRSLVWLCAWMNQKSALDCLWNLWLTTVPSSGVLATQRGLLTFSTHSAGKSLLIIPLFLHLRNSYCFTQSTFNHGQSCIPSCRFVGNFLASTKLSKTVQRFPMLLILAVWFNSEWPRSYQSADTDRLCCCSQPVCMQEQFLATVLL